MKRAMMEPTGEKRCDLEFAVFKSLGGQPGLSYTVHFYWERGAGGCMIEFSTYALETWG